MSRPRCTPCWPNLTPCVPPPLAGYRIHTSARRERLPLPLREGVGGRGRSAIARTICSTPSRFQITSSSQTRSTRNPCRRIQASRRASARRSSWVMPSTSMTRRADGQKKSAMNRPIGAWRRTPGSSPGARLQAVDLTSTQAAPQHALGARRRPAHRTRVQQQRRCDPSLGPLPQGERESLSSVGRMSRACREEWMMCERDSPLREGVGGGCTA